MTPMAVWRMYGDGVGGKARGLSLGEGETLQEPDPAQWQGRQRGGRWAVWLGGRIDSAWVKESRPDLQLLSPRTASA